MTTTLTGPPTLPDAVAPLFAPPLATDLVALRRDLHRHPELSWQESRTVGALERALGALGVGDVRRVLDTALVARIPGRVRGAPIVAVRGDIDALPIVEATGLAFASSVDGVMHACGHDVHASWAVGAAALLRDRPAEGDVLVVLQPAEEQGSGAAAVVASGALDEARVIFGAHVDRRFEVGQVVADVGPVNASADTFEIVLRGAGAHAARPHESADPIVALAALVTALQTLVSRRLDPALPGVVTVGAVHAGDAPNVIPERAALRGTVRATTPQSRSLLVGEVKRVAEQIGAAYRVAADVTFADGTPPVVNEPLATGWARAAAELVLGAESLVPFGTTNMGGEDFAFYLERMPGCFLRVGAREPGGERIAAHSPRFYAAEASLFVGAAVLAEAARVASAALAADALG
jgi:amidohydrolase